MNPFFLVAIAALLTGLYQEHTKKETKSNANANTAGEPKKQMPFNPAAKPTGTGEEQQTGATT